MPSGAGDAPVRVPSLTLAPSYCPAFHNGQGSIYSLMLDVAEGLTYLHDMNIMWVRPGLAAVWHMSHGLSPCQAILSVRAAQSPQLFDLVPLFLCISRVTHPAMPFN